MAVSADLTISIRDLSQLPSDDRDLKAFVVDVIAAELTNRIKGAIGATRDVLSPELEQRGVSVGISISATF